MSPLISTFTGVSATAYGFTRGGGASPGPWFMMIITDTTPATQLYDIQITSDADGNVYYLYSSASSVQEPKVFKISNTGAITWARRFYGSSWSQDQNKVNWSNGSLYVSGVNGTGSNQYNYAMKINADGTTAVSRNNYVAAATSYHQGVAADTSGNIYSMGMWYTGSNYQSFILQYTAAGALGWGWRWFNYDTAASITFGTSYLFTSYYSDLYKWNTSGTLINSRQISGAGSFGNKIGIDASDNTYRSGASGSTGYISKFDSDLLPVWAKTFSGFTGLSQYKQGATIDTTGNVYAYWAAPGQAKSLLVIKTNNAGVVQWQRSLAVTISGSSPYIYNAVSCNYVNGDLMVSVQPDSGTNRPAFLLKLPADGTKTGTYTNGIYSATWASESLTISTSSTTTGSAANPSGISPTVGSAVPSNAAFTNYATATTNIT